jgi:hypothetical protein
MRNYSTLVSCPATQFTTNASLTACLRNASEQLAQFTSPVKEFWEYVVEKNQIEKKYIIQFKNLDVIHFK